MLTNLWTGGGASQPHTMACSIKEANEHMRAMHVRILDLEQRAREQAELLERREQEQKVQLGQLQRAREQDAATVRQEKQRLQQRCAQLEQMLWERDCQIADLHHKVSFLSEAASYAPYLENLALCLKSAFNTTPPKIQTVKPTRTNADDSPRPGSAQNMPAAKHPPNHARSNEATAIISAVKADI